MRLERRRTSTRLGEGWPEHEAKQWIMTERRLATGMHDVLDIGHPLSLEKVDLDMKQSNELVMRCGTSAGCCQTNKQWQQQINGSLMQSSKNNSQTHVSIKVTTWRGTTKYLLFTLPFGTKHRTSYSYGFLLGKLWDRHCSFRRSQAPSVASCRCLHKRLPSLPCCWYMQERASLMTTVQLLMTTVQLPRCNCLSAIASVQLPCWTSSMTSIRLPQVCCPHACQVPMQVQDPETPRRSLA